MPMGFLGFGRIKSMSVVLNATVAQASALQANKGVSSFAVRDTAANVRANLASLASDTKLTSITLSDASTPTLTLAGAAYATDASALAKISSAYHLLVNGAAASQAAGLQANPHVTSFTITDAATNIQGLLPALVADTKVTSIVLSDASTPVLTLAGAAFAVDASALAKITSPYYLVVTGATAGQAASLQANAHVTSFTITDTAANIQASLTALNADSHLQSVTVSNGQPVTITYSQFASDTALVGKMGNATFDVTGVSAANAGSVIQNSHIKAEGIADTLADFGANLTALEALAKAGKLTGISITDTGQTLTISQSQYAADIDAIKLLTGQFTIHQLAPTPTPSSGLQIHYVDDSSMANAPASYISALTTAASLLEANVTDNISLNIQVGWGEIAGSPIQSGVAEGATNGDIYQSYSTVRSELIAHDTGPAAAAASLLPSSDPFGGAFYDVSGAQAKAWGLTSATSNQIDGEIGVSSSGWPSSDYVAVLLHELTHALGRNSGWGGSNGDTTPLDLFRYSAPGVHVTDGSVVDPSINPGATTLQYFSLDGGHTVLADYANTSDYGDWASNSLTVNDPNNAYLGSNSNALTPVDLLQLCTMGFHLGSNALSTITASGLKVG